ncbi:unnamed protein product [Rotaria sp. Silwood1]|nr:unnamed protein product [Rotaria sp. Silwood1]
MKVTNDRSTFLEKKIHPHDINNNGNESVSMVVRFGDLIAETSDVIVVCWSSKYLLEMIYECGGSSVRTAVNNQIEKKSKKLLTSVK